MKWTFIAGACALSSLVLTSTTEANDQSVNAETYNGALVRVDCGEDCWGTGFFVQSNPPVVATCYHVVEDRDRVTVSARGFPKPFEVETIRPYPNQDIAFIRLKNVTSWSVKIPWKNKTSVAEPLGARLQFYGLKYFDGLDMLLPGSVKVLSWKDLAKLGGPRDLPIVPLDFAVLAFEQDPREPLAGDSGGPIFNSNGELVGLVAGSARQVGTQTWRHFGVGLTTDVPGTGDSGWTSKRLTAHDPYYHAEISRHVAKLVHEKTILSDELNAHAASVSTDAQCAKALEEVSGAYRGRWANLPAKGTPEFDRSIEALKVKLGSDCADRYERSRPDLAVYEEESAIHDGAELMKSAADTSTVDARLAAISDGLDRLKGPNSKAQLAEIAKTLKNHHVKDPALDALEADLSQSTALDKKKLGAGIEALKREQKDLEKKREEIVDARSKAEEVEKRAGKRADAAAKRALAILLGKTPSKP